MKKLFLLSGIAVGAVVGLCVAIPDGLGLMIVMAAIGVVVGAAVGMAMSRVLDRDPPILCDSVSMSGNDFPVIGQPGTYWRDKGKICPMPGHPDPEGATRAEDELL